MARNNEHTWGRRIAAGVLIAVGGTALTACAPSERPAATATADAPAPSPSDTTSQAPTEHLGQDTEIAHDQLTILEQKTSIEDMAAMSVEDFAKLSVADRAAYGFHLTQKLLGADKLEWNVGELKDDKLSFYGNDPMQSANGVLSAVEDQTKAIVGSGLSEKDARDLLLAQTYSPTSGGVLTADAKNRMETYAHYAQVDSQDIAPRSAANASGWNRVGDQWVKAIECVTHGSNDTVDVDQTVQFVRVTVKLPDGKEIFWYMEANVANGNEVTTLATQPLK